MDGQAAPAPEAGSIDALASFFADTPVEESQEEELVAEESTEEGDDSDAKPQLEEDAETEEEADAEAEADPKAEAEKPATEEIEVTVKSEDGSDTVIKVTKDELVKGYQRQADYTRKTQALGERETQAVEVFKTKYGELQQEYVRKAEFATQAVIRMAGFRSDAEMEQLARQDPASWVLENQRQNQIRQLLGTLVDQTKAERQQASEEAENYQTMQIKKQTERSWVELQKDGIDKQKLQKTYESVMKNYGYEPKDLASVTDYRLVRMMADANAFRELKAKAPVVTQQAKAAPKLQTKQTIQASTRQAQAINSKFDSGKARRQDLASFMRTL